MPTTWLFSWRLWALLLGGLLLVGVCFLSSTPGCQATRDELPLPDGARPRPKRPLDALRLPWDSEDHSAWPAAELLARLAKAAYLTSAEARPEFAEMGLTAVQEISDKSMMALVGTGEDVAVVVFRGTDDRADWLVNLDRTPASEKHGEVHRGFASAYEPMDKPIAAALQAANARHVWITGHSLGGALAVVCAYRLDERHSLPVKGLVTFGQPMVARQNLADHLSARLPHRYAHFVNEADAVPRIPPSYSHFGSLVWFTGGGVKRSEARPMVYGAEPGAPTEKENPLRPMTEMEFAEFRREVQAEAVPKRTPEGIPIYEGKSPWIRDHSMDLYLEAIRKHSQVAEK